ncbi:metallophosphoesterase family protein [Metallibacterium scheffleri]
MHADSSSILIAGDLHGVRKHLLPVVQTARPRALILLGDVEAPEPLGRWLEAIERLGTEVWFIHGNHDTDHEQTWASLDAVRDRNLDGRVVHMGGLRVAGLGGVFRETIWHPSWRDGQPAFPSFDAYVEHESQRTAPTRRDALLHSGRLRQHRSSVFPDTFERLATEQADVLVTHEAPSCHPHGFRQIDELARALGAHTVFHGHHHDRLDYSTWFPGLGFKVYGVGLRGLTWLDGRVERDGEIDAMRAKRGLGPPDANVD